MSRRQDLGLDLFYSYRGLAAVIEELSGRTMCHKVLHRLLDAGGVHRRRDGHIWVSDIEAEMPHLLESLDVLIHRRRMGD